MIYQELLRIQKPFFSLEDVAYTLGLQPASAAVLCSRYVKKGLLTRLKRGLYARTEHLAHLSQVDLFRIANFLQVPCSHTMASARRCREAFLNPFPLSEQGYLRRAGSPFITQKSGQTFIEVLKKRKEYLLLCLKRRYWIHSTLLPLGAIPRISHPLI